MSNRKNISEKIEAAQEEIRQREAHLKLLLNQQKEQKRKARIHRFCKRGGLMENMLPDLARLDDEQFQTFVNKVLLTPFTGRILSGLLPNTAEPITESGRAADAVEPANPAHPGHASAPVKPGDRARNAS